MDDEARWGPLAPLAPFEVQPEPEPPERRRFPLVAVALVAILVVGVVAAGLFLVVRGDGGEAPEQVTSEKNGSPAAVLGSAPAATRAGKTARIRTSMRSFDGGEATHDGVEGVISFDRGAFDLTYSYGPPGSFPGSLDPSDRVFSDGLTVWSALPDLASDMPFGFPGPKVENPFPGKRYMAEKVDPSATMSSSESSFFGSHALGFSIGSSPGDVLTYLTSVGTAVKEGKEQIDGEDVTRYGADVDLDALQRALPSEEREFDGYDFRPDVPHTFPATVWLDGEGRLRKLTYRLDLSVLLTDVALKEDYVIVEDCAEPDPVLLAKAQAGDPKAMQDMMAVDAQCTERLPRPEELVIEGSVELSAYGTPLDVEPPPAADVVSVEEFDAFMSSQADAAIAGSPFPFPFPVPAPAPPGP